MKVQDKHYETVWLEELGVHCHRQNDQSTPVATSF